MQCHHPLIFLIFYLLQQLLPRLVLLGYAKHKYFLFIFLWKVTLSSSLPQCAYYTKAFHLPLPGVHSATNSQLLQHLCSGFGKSNFTDHELSYHCLLDRSVKDMHSLSAVLQ